jgi:hypothetical protein
MMAPAITAPPTTPAAIPGPHPHPRCHQAEASVAVPATITTIVAAPSKLTMVFFINLSLRVGGLRSGRVGRVGDTTTDLTELNAPKMSKAAIVIRRGTLREYERHITE